MSTTVKEYSLDIHSSYSSLGILTLSVIGFLMLGIGALKVHKTVFEIPFFVVWIVSSWYFIKKGAQGEAKVILAKHTLEVKWLKKPFCSLQTNKKIQLSEITGWKYVSNMHFGVLKIYLRHNENIRLEKKVSLELKSEPDDFYKFRNDLEQLVIRENKRRKKANTSLKQEAGESKRRKEEKQKPIVDKEAEFYQGCQGKIMYYLAIAMCLAGGVLLIFSQKLDLSNVFGLIAALSGAVFFIMRYRKMAQKYNR